MRGNRCRSPRSWSRSGSIPACAGKPSTRSSVMPSPAVDPRVCGETPSLASAGVFEYGRSPRVRGNPVPIVRDRRPLGSIPACAGKPPPPAGRRSAPGVDPRVCGETIWTVDHIHHLPGRSPRVRGNLTPLLAGQAFHRSIPACAGKPSRPHRSRSRTEVDPRVCGETRVSEPASSCWLGRSPRVRGNPEWVSHKRHLSGSIPACAGKPSRPRAAAATWRVDPRVCGETPDTIADLHASDGRSPRVRGNL